MRFLFFSKGERKIPSSRYRAYYLAEALESLGHEAAVIPVAVHTFGDFMRYLRILFSAKKGDVVFLQRTIYSRAFIIAVLIARVFGTRYVFDIDDSTIYEGTARRAKTLARLARLVTGGSEFVLSWARIQNKHTAYLPNGLPLSIYTARAEATTGIPIIGWIGDGPVHVKNLAILPPVFAALRAKGIAFRFRLVGAVGDSRIYDLFKDTPEAELVDAIDWADPKNAVHEIQSFAVGVMPLDTEKLNNAKYFKALEYMGCGVPVVGSAATTLEALFESARSGFVARDTQEWVTQLSRLLQDAELRAEEGKKGREAVERNYSSIAMARTLLTELGASGFAPNLVPELDLSIVVLNWNTSELVSGSLDAILETTKRARYEITAIDNHSSDGGFSHVRADLKADPRISFHEYYENAGWKAINGFFAHARGKYLVTIDPDARLEDGCLDALFDFMETHPEAGAATADLMNTDRTPQRYFRRLFYPSTFLWASVPGRIIDRLFFSSRHFRYARYEDTDLEALNEIEQPSWPALIVRREALCGHTFVDPEFSFYFLDVDLSRRIYAAGYRIFLVRDARAVHMKSTSYQRADAKWRAKNYDDSLIRFFRAYHPRLAPVLVPLVRLDRMLKALTARLGLRF